MMNGVSGIVANGKPQVVTWMEQAEKKRMDELQQKSKDGTISKMEKVELCTKEVAEALKNLSSQPINFNGVQKTNLESTKNIEVEQLTMEDIENLRERNVKGLNHQVLEAITNLSVEQRKIFYKKDDKGNYMLPTKVLNHLAKNEISLRPYRGNDSIIILKSYMSPNQEEYAIWQDKDYNGIERVVIQQRNSSACFEAYSNGTYTNITSNIIGDKLEGGKTKKLN